MGAVYLAVRSDEQHRPMALKRLRETCFVGSTDALRLKHEGSIAVSVDSPHIVRVDDVGAVGEEPYVAMEYLFGWPLSRLLQHLHVERRHLSVQASLSIVAGILRGLDALHSAVDPETGQPLAVVHRDISPRNVILALSDFGSEQRARSVIIDFGLGMSNLREWATRTGLMLGTPGYMAPEQYSGGRVDHRADLYAAAVIGFELVTLKHYVRRGPLSEMAALCSNAYRPLSPLRVGLNDEIEEVFRRSLSINLEERYPSAKEMLAALERAAGTALDSPEVTDLPAALAVDLTMQRADVECLLDGLETPEPTQSVIRTFARRTRPPPRIPTIPTVSMTGQPPERDAPADSITAPSPRRASLIRVPRPISPFRSLGLMLGAASAVLLIGALLQATSSTARKRPQAPVAHPLITIEPVVEVKPHAEPTLPAAEDHALPNRNHATEDESNTGPRSRRRVAPSMSPKPEPRPAVTVQPSLEDQIDRLARRAEALKRAHPELTAPTNKVMTDLALWRSSSEASKLSAAIDALDKRLSEIEAGSVQ
jgi:serine/threonine-protein kinase